MKQRASQPHLLGVLLLVVAVPACTDVDAEAKGKYFSCAKPSDCLSGYSCICGYCIQGHAPADFCPADTADTSDTAVGDDTATNDDTLSGTDAGPDSSGACDLVTWAGCEAGKGCYYLQNQPTCKTRGNLGYQATCNPSSTTPQCGEAQVAGESAKLLCDVVDAKCYPTCNCDTTKVCANGMTCFCLSDQGKNLPGGAGICAP